MKPYTTTCLWRGCYQPSHGSFCEKHKAVFDSQFTPTDYFKMINRLQRAEMADEE